MITKTPSRASSLTSSACRVCPERMILAVSSARISAVSSTVVSRASLSKKKSATRHLMGKCSRPLQGVARPTHGADQLLFTRGVHLSPEVADVDIHHVRGKAELLVPDAREHPARVLGHELEQLVLAGR